MRRYAGAVVLALSAILIPSMAASAHVSARPAAVGSLASPSPSPSPSPSAGAGSAATPLPVIPTASPTTKPQAVPPLFAADSPFNTPIPADPVLDDNSAEWSSYIAGDGYEQATLLYEDGVPIYDANAATPRVRVRVTNDWGLHPTSVPIPAGATPATGPDGAMVVIDWSTRRHYDFWQARRGPNGWTASWLTVASIDDSGVPGNNVGAGVSRLVGVVRAAEIAAGEINHALVFAAPFAGRDFREPATKSDGANQIGVPTPMPEGTRIQLDPSIDVAAIPGITRGEMAVAKALQTYGAYLIDNGGYRAMGFSFERPQAGGTDPYPAAGLHDYAGMPHIPWDRIRALRAWDGS
jgi:hypothetical protein